MTLSCCCAAINRYTAVLNSLILWRRRLSSRRPLSAGGRVTCTRLLALAVFLNNVVLTEAKGACGQVVTGVRYCFFAFAALFVVISGGFVSYLIVEAFQEDEDSVWLLCCNSECGDYSGSTEEEPEEGQQKGTPPPSSCSPEYGYPNTTTTKVQVRRLDQDEYQEGIPLRDHLWGIATTTTTTWHLWGIATTTTTPWLHEQRQNSSTSYNLRETTALAVNSSMAEQKSEDEYQEDIPLRDYLWSIATTTTTSWLHEQRQNSSTSYNFRGGTALAVNSSIAEQKAEELLDSLNVWGFPEASWDLAPRATHTLLREDITVTEIEKTLLGGDITVRLLSARRKRRPWFPRWLKSNLRWMKSNLQWLNWNIAAEQKTDQEPLREDEAAASRLLSARRKRRPWFLRWLA